MTTLCHASVAILDRVQTDAVLDWIIQGGTSSYPMSDDPAPRWLHAAAADGLVTGRYDPAARRWTTSADVAAGTPGVGTLSRETLITVRVFDETTEVLLQRTPDGSWRGRRIADSDANVALDDPTRPITRRLLVGGESARSLQHGFTHVTAAGGRTHIVPVRWQQPAVDGRGTALVVREYLAEDDDTGQLRVAAHRLVGFTDRWRTRP